MECRSITRRHDVMQPNTKAAHSTPHTPETLSPIRMKRTVRKYYLLLLATVVILSCQTNEKFDSEKWNNKSIVDFEITDVREGMLNDLLDSRVLIGKSKSEIIELLGKPEIANDSKITYLVREKYGSNIDPLYIKYLELNLDKMGTTKNQKIIIKQ